MTPGSTPAPLTVPRCRTNRGRSCSAPRRCRPSPSSRSTRTLSGCPPTTSARPSIELHAEGVRHLLVEGGPQVLGAFFAAGAVDEVFCYQAPLLIGPGRRSVDGLGIDTLGDALRLLPDDTEVPAVSRLGPDFLLHFVADSAPAP
jgi:hypothetical protein